MTRFIFILILWILSESAWSQQIRLIGSIVDDNTNEPVPYASVAILNAGVGTSANLDGYFDLLIEKPVSEDTLIITCIGYNRYVVALEALNVKDPIIFKILQSTTMLSEVVVEEEGISAIGLVQRASKKLKSNYSVSPYLSGSVYRETVKLDGKFVGFTDAVGIIYVGGYNRQFNSYKNKSYTYDLIQWKNIRRSKYSITNEFYDPKYLFVDKLIRAKDLYTYSGPLNSKQIKNFIYSIDSVTFYGEELVYMVSFRDRSDEQAMRGNIFIKASDYAVLSLEITDQKQVINYRNAAKEISYKLNHFIVKYAYFQEKYYLNYMRLKGSYGLGGDPKTSVQVEEVQELTGGQFNTGKALPLNYGQRTVLFSEMLNPRVIYNPGFWDKYKISDISNLDRISRDLGQISSLETQFLTNSQKRLVPLPEGFNTYEQIYRDRETFDVFFPNY